MLVCIYSSWCHLIGWLNIICINKKVGVQVYLIKWSLSVHALTSAASSKIVCVKKSQACMPQCISCSETAWICSERLLLPVHTCFVVYCAPDVLQCGRTPGSEVGGFTAPLSWSSYVMSCPFKGKLWQHVEVSCEQRPVCTAGLSSALGDLCACRFLRFPWKWPLIQPWKAAVQIL